MSIKLIGFSVFMGIAASYFSASSAQAFGETVPGINGEYKSIALFRLKEAGVEFSAVTTNDVDGFCHEKATTMAQGAICTK
jgi:hypothetical protein